GTTPYIVTQAMCMLRAIGVPLFLAAVPLAFVHSSGCSGGGAAVGPAAAEAGSPSTDDAGVQHMRVPYAGLPSADAGPRTPVHAGFVSIRVDAMQLMFAAGEMQTSGEPFASGFAGRNLQDYDRYYLPPDQYLVKLSNGRSFFTTTTDLFGFSTAVESY